MRPIKALTWCLRNWGWLMVMALVAFVCTTYWGVYDDKAQRERLNVALSMIVPIRDAVNEQFTKSGKFPSDLRPFVKQSQYTIDHPKLGRIGFAVTAEGQRLSLLFDSDQGPFSDKAVIVEGTEKNGSTNWSCLAPGVPGRYVPSVCR